MTDPTLVSPDEPSLAEWDLPHAVAIPGTVDPKVAPVHAIVPD
jgi:hypothetical protein